MYRAKRIPITDVNEHLKCGLCKGYFVDATTITECLHTFCKSCIVKYLETNKYCPVCDVQVHKTRPLLNIRSDKIIQDLVYKLVPRLYQNETNRKVEFYKTHPETQPTFFEESTEAAYQYILSPEEQINVILNYYGGTTTPRYLRCPAALSVIHLQKLIRAKYDLSDSHHVDIIFNNDSLHPSWTLMDVSYMYLSTQPKGNIELKYRIYEYAAKKQKLNEGVENSAQNNNNWKEVHLKISENGEMSITTALQDNLNLLDLVDKNLAPENEPSSNKQIEPESSKLNKKKKELPGLKLISKNTSEVKTDLVPPPVLNNHTDTTTTVYSTINSIKCSTNCDTKSTINNVKSDDKKPLKRKLEPTQNEPNKKLNTAQNVHKRLLLQKKDKKNTIANNDVLKTNNNIPNKKEEPPKIESPKGEALKNELLKSEPVKPVIDMPSLEPQNTSKNDAVMPKSLPSTSAKKITEKVQKKAPFVNVFTNVKPTNDLKQPSNEKSPKIEQNVTPEATLPKNEKQKSSNEKTSLPTTIKNEKHLVSLPSRLGSPKGELILPKSVTLTMRTDVSTPKTYSAQKSESKPKKDEKPKATPLKQEAPPTKTNTPPIKTIAPPIKPNSTPTRTDLNITKTSVTPETTPRTSATPSKSEATPQTQAPPTRQLQDTPLKGELILPKSISVTVKRTDGSHMTVSNKLSAAPSPPGVQIVKQQNSVRAKSSTPIGYKTLKDPPKSWNSQIANVNKSEAKQGQDLKNVRPAKFFKMRNNMPRYLGNPASGVKPMYSVHNSPEKDKKDSKTEKSEIKKHSIVKIDPKTLKPISEKAPATTSLSNHTTSLNNHSDLKINTSSVSIFNPLKLQHSPKNSDRNSPKSPHSPILTKNKSVSPPSKARDKLNLNFTPSNPFIPNLTSPTMSPNQFLCSSGPPGFPSYDPRVMAAYHHLFYGQRMPFPTPTLPHLNMDFSQGQRNGGFDLGVAQQQQQQQQKSPKMGNMGQQSSLSPQGINVSQPTSKKPPPTILNSQIRLSVPQMISRTSSMALKKSLKEASKSDKSLLNAVEKLTQNRVKETQNVKTVVNKAEREKESTNSNNKNVRKIEEKKENVSIEQKEQSTAKNEVKNNQKDVKLQNHTTESKTPVLKPSETKEKLEKSVENVKSDKASKSAEKSEAAVTKTNEQPSNTSQASLNKSESTPPQTEALKCKQITEIKETSDNKPEISSGKAEKEKPKEEVQIKEETPPLNNAKVTENKEDLLATSNNTKKVIVKEESDKDNIKTEVHVQDNNKETKSESDLSSTNAKSSDVEKTKRVEGKNEN